jgi:Ca2+-binding EF-hand superfamily protein
LRPCSVGFSMVPPRWLSCFEFAIEQVIFFWTLLARHMSRCFDSDSSLRPSHDSVQRLFRATPHEKHRITLSSGQEAQISDIFNLFDTDGGGFIDQGELSFAMQALGFKSKKSSESSNKIMGSLMEDGSVSLEEFGLLMMGEVSGQGPMADVQAVFTLLSREDGRPEHSSLITLDKLQSACKEFKVSPSHNPPPCPSCSCQSWGSLIFPWLISQLLCTCRLLQLHTPTLV